MQTITINNNIEIDGSSNFIVSPIKVVTEDQSSASKIASLSSLNLSIQPSVHSPFSPYGCQLEINYSDTFWDSINGIQYYFNFNPELETGEINEFTKETTLYIKNQIVLECDQNPKSALKLSIDTNTNPIPLSFDKPVAELSQLNINGGTPPFLLYFDQPLYMNQMKLYKYNPTSSWNTIYFYTTETFNNATSPSRVYNLTVNNSLYWQANQRSYGIGVYLAGPYKLHVLDSQGNHDSIEFNAENPENWRSCLYSYKRSDQTLFKKIDIAIEKTKMGKYNWYGCGSVGGLGCPSFKMIIERPAIITHDRGECSIEVNEAIITHRGEIRGKKSRVRELSNGRYEVDMPAQAAIRLHYEFLR
jgi:hypothetical protein